MDRDFVKRPITITIDHRESRSPVVAALRESTGIATTLARLDCGDYLIDNRFLVERKTLPDLIESIKSGRLFDQALRLAAVQQWRPALILEGTARDIEGSGMRWEALQGALVTVSLFIGLPVLRTRSARETVNTFRFVARQGRTVASGALPRRGARPKGKRALQSHILQSLPRVGAERAARLLDRFGSVEAVIRACDAELKEVEGIGPRTARCIRWAVEERGGEYVAT
jgi:DNA excision repair protein ERCC-4